jgi:hypothetical protein
MINSSVGFVDNVSRPFEALAQAVRIRRYEEAYYALIASHMDESFDKADQGVFVVGGFLGRGVPLFELDRRWEKLRKRPDIDIAYFKASECHSGSGEFKKFVVDPDSITSDERLKLDSISLEFLKLVANPILFDKKHYFCAHGVGMIQKDFYEVIQDPNAKAILGNSPYRLVYDLAFIQCAWAMKQLDESIKIDRLKNLSDKPSKEPVSFVCDEHQEHILHADQAYRNLKQNNPSAAEYMATFSMADDKQCEPLQAADAMAFEVRRALDLSLKYWPGNLREQFTFLQGKVMFLISYCKKDQLIHIVNTHKPGEPFKLDLLMDAQLNENIKLVL